MKFLVIDRPDSWHVKDLRRAAADRHRIDTVEYSEVSVCFGDDREGDIQTESRFFAAGKCVGDYDCVITRAMPASSLEQVVFRMDWLDQLESQSGTIVVNPAKTVEASVDKYLSLEKLRAAGLRVPASCVSQTTEMALEFFLCHGSDSVVKPIFGSRGRNVVRIQNEAKAKTYFEGLEESQQIIYQQRYVEHGDSDIRLLVIGDQVFGMRRRRPGHWVTNASQGAECFHHDPTAEERELAISAARSVNAVLAGVDIVYQSGNKVNPKIVEINACPAWKSIQTATGQDVAQTLVEFAEHRAACIAER